MDEKTTMKVVDEDLGHVVCCECGYETEREINDEGCFKLGVCPHGCKPQTFIENIPPETIMNAQNPGNLVHCHVRGCGAICDPDVDGGVIGEIFAPAGFAMNVYTCKKCMNKKEV
jgi:hypothetical protein